MWDCQRLIVMVLLFEQQMSNKSDKKGGFDVISTATTKHVI